MEPNIFYRRRLPHIQPPEGCYTVTYRLAGTLPKSIVQKLKEAYQANKQEILDQYNGQEEAAKEELKALREAYFEKTDRYLDQALEGPTWLSDPAIAEIIKESLHFVENYLQYWTIWSYCIMSNHVHLEFTLAPKAPALSQVMKSHKNFTALHSNRQLGRKGSFWQEESFDRLIRDEDDFFRRIFYTINNPVEAHLVKDWREWPHTYVHPEIRELLV